MSFFVTSRGMGNGGNMGGLAGADAFCQELATSVGRGNVTWHAYLSTQGPNAVNARDRIGTGPWANQAGRTIASSVSTLHYDTMEDVRKGNAFSKLNSLDEKGNPIPDNEHDILTGSQRDGRAYPDGNRSCNNWTDNTHVDVPAFGPAPVNPTTPSAIVGHEDIGVMITSWNSAHQTSGCSQQNLVGTGGGGRLYCFATN